MYSDAVLDRVRHLKRVGTLPDDAADVGAGRAGTLDAGTSARIWVRVAGTGIIEARFQVFGCSAAIAAAAFVAERLEGAALHEAPPTPAAIVAALSLPVERRHVAEIVAAAARDAVDEAVRKTGYER